MNPATEGVETAWEHSWTWPAWATLALFLACAVLVLWLYRRERGNAGGTMRLALVALRVSLVALVLWMMYGWVQHRHRTDLPELIVVVDDSTSMTTIDRDPSEDAASGGTKTNAASGKKGERPAAGARDAASSTRFSQVQRWLAADDGGALKELERRYRVRVYMAGRTARPVVPEAARLNETNASTTVAPSGTTVVELVANWQPTEPASRLGQCLIDVLQAQRGRPTAAVVLLSDGVTTEGRTLAEAADLARRRHVPLYCIGVGADRLPRDLRLDDLVSDDVGFVGDLFPFETRLTGSGYSGRSVRLRLVRTDSGAVLAEQTVTIPDDAESLPVRLAFRPKTQGELSLALVAESLPGEATTENNRLVRTVTIREEKLRVLLVQAAPSYEYRYLKTLLQRQRQADGNRERAVELTTVLQEADPEYPAGDETAAATFPANRDALFAYDVVVLGDADPRLLGTAALDNLAAFVRERGGGLLVCAGPRFMPVAYRGTALSELLPVEIDAVTYPPPDASLATTFVPRLTRLGRATPSLQLDDTADASEKRWNSLPGWYWYASATRLREGTRVLAEHPTAVGPTGQPLPLLAVQFVGAGKVAVQLSDESWRWSRVAEGEQAYARYWLQWLRWLSRSRLQGGERAVQLTADRERYLTSDSVRLRVRFLDERLAPAADDGVTVMVQGDAGGPQATTLRRESAERGVFATTLAPLAEGTYRAWLVAPESSGTPPTTRFTVVAPAGEQTRLTLDAAALQEAATISQGRYYPWENVRRLLADLPRGRQVRIESLPSAPLWNRWPVIALFLSILTAEWLLRKRVGML